jgi:hypothetical protein
MLVHQQEFQHPFTPAKVVLLSGLSDPTTCALTPVQQQFLSALHVPEAWKVYWNFPYVPCPGEPGQTPLWRASWQNFRQFVLASRRSYRTAARRHWQALVRSTEELFVITLSCGLEILNNSLSAHWPIPRVHVFALGPVAWRKPRVGHTLIQGASDAISKLFFRKVDVLLPGVGHMNYFQHESVFRLIDEALPPSQDTQ